MKKILLISDTHGYIDEKIVKYANKVDEIWQEIITSALENA